MELGRGHQCGESRDKVLGLERHLGIEVETLDANLEPQLYIGGGRLGTDDTRHAFFCARDDTCRSRQKFYYRL